MVVYIKQIGSDGLGHQLHGLFTCLVLHGVRNYYFDSYSYLNNDFKFEHLNHDESVQAKQYLIECNMQFIKEYNLSPINYENYIFSHEIWKIPKNSENHNLYGLDNVFFFDKIPELNEEEKKNIYKNIDVMKKFFINKHLPQNKLKENNIVIHIRLGDAMTTGRGCDISTYNQKLLNLIDIFNIKYPNYNYYIHTDGEIDFIEKKMKNLKINYNIYNKNTKILDVLSDLINSKILVCGISSLSSVCSFFGNKELIIHNYSKDPISMPISNIFTINEYINNFTKN